MRRYLHSCVSNTHLILTSVPQETAGDPLFTVQNRARKSNSVKLTRADLRERNGFHSFLEFHHFWNHFWSLKCQKTRHIFGVNAKWDLGRHYTVSYLSTMDVQVTEQNLEPAATEGCKLQVQGSARSPVRPWY